MDDASAIGNHDSEREPEELRFAVVLNGGVSLAVWMGGVTYELDQLTRGALGYSRVMDKLGVNARADVIAGTSAGGINGAALALAQVNKNADLSTLRDMWAEQGTLENLLHEPFRGELASLLRGDEYFLPELNKAMASLTAAWQPRTLQERPVDLTITTTLLHGAVAVTTDSFGQLLSQRRHDGIFRFFRGIDDADRPIDDFKVGRSSSIARALALAARCSASYPLAFEPSYVPVNDDSADGRDPEMWPDMASFANWRAIGLPGSAAANRSRFAVDGGLLANMPTKAALAGVQRMRAGAMVERVMVLVFPHAPTGSADSADDPATPPAVTKTVASLLAALTSQGTRTFVEEVGAHNRRVQSRRGTRRDILLLAADDAAQRDEKLHRLAGDLYPHYRELRMRAAGRDLAARIPDPEDRSYERIRAAAEAAQRAWIPARGPSVPYVPAQLTEAEGLPRHRWLLGTTAALDLADIALEYLSVLHEAWPVPDTDPIRLARSRTHDAVAQMRWVRDCIDLPWWRSAALAKLTPDESYWTLRLNAYSWFMLGDPGALTAILAAGFPVSAALGSTSLRLDGKGPADDDPAWYNPTGDDEIRLRISALNAAGGVAGQRTAEAVKQVMGAVAGVMDQLDPSARIALQGALDEAWHDWPSRPATADRMASVHSIFRSLLDLHVISWTIGGEQPTESSSPLKLVQISAQTPNAFAVATRTLDDKLGGASLARFSGFLKRSWRLNDWTWGRCDGATMLFRVLVTPERVLRYATRRRLDEPERVVDDLLAAALDLEDSSAVESWITDAAPDRSLTLLRKEAIKEVRDVLDPGLVQEQLVSRSAARAETPDALPKLADLLAYPHHATIALTEIPAIAAAVRADRLDGANVRSRGELFLVEHEGLLKQIAELPADPAERLKLGMQCLRAFDRAGIGREPLDREVSSDQMIRTSVTTASVAATVADSSSSGVGFAKPVTKAVRGAMLVPYWITKGLTAGSRTAQYLGLLGLTVGGVLLALSLLGVLQPPLAGIAAMLGAGTALAALAYAALRTGSLLHGVVLLAPGLVLVAIGLGWARESEVESGMQPSLELGAIGATIALVVALIILGSLPGPIRTPQALIADMRRRRTDQQSEALPTAYRTVGTIGWIVLAVTLVVVAAVVAALAAQSPRLQNLPTWLVAAVVVAVIAAGALAAWDGRQLRLWRRHQGSWVESRVEHQSAITAAWSVVYGVLFLIGGLAIELWWPADAGGWERTAVVLVMVGLAIILTLVVPLVATRLARKRIQRRLVDIARTGLIQLPTTGQDGEPLRGISDQLAAWLVSRDMAYRYLLNRHHDGQLKPSHVEEALARDVAEAIRRAS